MALYLSEICFCPHPPLQGKSIITAHKCWLWHSTLCYFSVCGHCHLWFHRGLGLLSWHLSFPCWFGSHDMLLVVQIARLKQEKCEYHSPNETNGHDVVLASPFILPWIFILVFLFSGLGVSCHLSSSISVLHAKNFFQFRSELCSVSLPTLSYLDSGCLVLLLLMGMTTFLVILFHKGMNTSYMLLPLLSQDVMRCI